MTSHLSGLNSTSQSTSHICSLSMSSCNVSATCVVLMLRHRSQSSAKSCMVEETWFGRSFMLQRKRMGANTDPCGTPEVIGTGEDFFPSRITSSERLLGKLKLFTHSSVFPRIP